MNTRAEGALRRTWPQRLIIVVGIGLVFGSVASAWTISSLYGSIGQIARIDIGPGVLDDRATNDPGGPRNILLVGTTENEGIDTSDELLAGRGDAMLSDTIMLLRLEPNTGQAAVMSINRDLWIPNVAGYQGKINGAIQTGGIERLVRVVQSYLQVPVNDFAIINFAGFRKLVDELGGVPVYFPYPARDFGSFFDMPDAGCHVLDGTLALNYVRSRHYEELRDGRWRAVPGDDHLRAERQRDFLILALDRAIEKGGRNPVTMRRLIEAVTDGGAITLDKLLSVRDLVKLGTSFAGFNPDNLDRLVLPALGFVTSGGASALDLQVEEAQPILDLFRGLGNTLRPDQVNVDVVEGRGKSLATGDKPNKLLADKGFKIRSTRSTTANDVRSRTTLTYSADQRNAALLLARNLAAKPAFEPVTGLRKLELTVGNDWAGVSPQPLPEDEFAGLVPGVAPPTPTTTLAPPTSASGGGSRTTIAATTTTEAPQEPSTTSGIIGRPPDGVTCN